MKFLYKYIGWKQNIEFIEVYKLQVDFIDKNSLEIFESFLCENPNLLINEKLRDSWIRRNIDYNNYEYDQFSGYSKQIEEDINATGWQSNRMNFYHKVDKSKSKIYNSFTLTSKEISSELILILIGKFSKLMSIITLTNNYLSSWDNQTSPEFYKYKGGLRTYFDKDFQLQRVDISDRPGRITDCKDFVFRGGSDYWFGPSFFQYIPKEELLSFTDCMINEELDNGVVHIKLFELQDYWKDENQRRIAALRKLLRVDEA